MIFHQQGPATQPITPPAFDRKVLRVPSVVTRAGLLELARVAHYCEFRRQICVVLLDHDLWPIRNVAGRFLPHGSYGRIHLPLPQVVGPETCRAVSLVETVGDTLNPTFEQVCPQLPTHMSCNHRVEDSEEPPPQNCMMDAICEDYGGVHQHHADEVHQVDPPTFETQIPAQAPPVFPNAPHWQDFELNMRILFEDQSHVDIPEEGPVLHVVTWFVHHDRSPSCLVGRLVRLSHRPWEWFQQLCIPWIHMLQPFANLAFHVVRPTPVSHIPGQQMVHVILEQGIQIARRVDLFSILFHGIHGDLTHRRAQSIPTHLSREVIERILGIAELCRHRRCTAWAGRGQFHRDRLEPVSQGIGISFTVAPFRNRYAQVDDDGFPISESASSSNIPSRISFRHEDASLYPNACWANDDSGSCLEHAPSRLVPDLRVIWERYLITATCRPFRFYVETWFCDHERFPRTDRGRSVLLPPDQDSWRDAILEKWSDLIDVSAEVFIYVVSPQPFGGPPDTLAHIILAQHHRGFISALITMLAPDDDPWDPPRVALKLPAVVDKALLLHESGLLPFCPPFIPNSACAAFIGDQPILQDVLRDAQSGDGFLCTVEPAPTLEVGIADDTKYERHMHWLFDGLSLLLTNVVKAVDQAVEKHATRAQSLAHVLFEFAQVEQDCLQMIGCIADDCISAPSPQPVGPVQINCPFTDQDMYGCVSAGDVHTAALVPPVIHLGFDLCNWLQAQFDNKSSATVAVQVWFSDHLRPHVSPEPAIVHLPQSAALWTTALTQPWESLICAGSVISCFLAHPRGLGLGHSCVADVILVQNPLPDIASVLMVFFPDGAVQDPPHIGLALVAEPISPLHLQFAFQQHPAFDCLDLRCDVHFTWGTTPVAAVGPPGLHHGECFGVFPVAPPDPWIGLVDHQFAKLLQSSFAATHEFPAPPTGSPVRLSLQAALPVTKVAPEERQFDDALPAISIFEHADWKHRIYDQCLPRLLPLPDGMIVPPSTYWALVDDTPLALDKPSWAELYVDGSTNAHSAAWSVVVVRTDGTAHHLVGTLFGRVQLASQADDWIGARTVDNIAAEFSAFAIALDLACRMVPVRCIIRPDLQLSAILAAQQCVTDSNPQLAHLISVLATWLPSNASVQEVRGHSAHPWNDLADSVARWALLHDPCVDHSVSVLHQLVTAGADLQWSWVQGGPKSLFHALPPVIDQQVCQFPLSLRRVPLETPCTSPLLEPSRCEVQVVSLNVLALDSLNQQVQLGRQRGQRTARLDLLWHQARAHIIGLQEARTLPGRHLTDHFLIFASGFEDPAAPRFGCEIWLHRTLPFVVLPDGLPICAPDFKFAVVDADPRRLVLRADHVACSFIVSVLHAPCLGKTKGNGHRPIDDIDVWWQETSRILDACEKATYHWICVDANAPLASHPTPCFDMAHAEPTNPQGALFETFLLRHDFAVPATFSDFHKGEAWMWTHSSGTRCRRDYVVVPVSLLPCVQDSFTMPTYD